MQKFCTLFLFRTKTSIFPKKRDTKLAQETQQSPFETIIEISGPISFYQYQPPQLFSYKCLCLNCNNEINMYKLTSFEIGQSVGLDFTFTMAGKSQIVHNWCAVESIYRSSVYRLLATYLCKQWTSEQRWH